MANANTDSVIQYLKDFLAHKSSQKGFMDVALFAYTVVAFKHTIAGVYNFKPEELYYAVMVLLPLSMVLQTTNGILNIIIHQKHKIYAEKLKNNEQIIGAQTESLVNQNGNYQTEDISANTKTVQTLELVHTILVFVVMILTIFIGAFIGAYDGDNDDKI